MTEPSEPTFTLQHPPIGSVIDTSIPRNTVEFRDSEFTLLAQITPDGIMHFTVDPTDENATKFIRCIETFLSTRINGIVVKGHAPVDFMDEARQFAIHCWTDDEGRQLPTDPNFTETVVRAIATWMETAAQHMRNEEFYRGLLDKCAAELGPVRPKVFVQDDGGIVIDPLRIKIPELVAELAAAATKWKLVEETANKPAPDPKFELARRAGELYERLTSVLADGYLDMELRQFGTRTDSQSKVFTYRWSVRRPGQPVTSSHFAVSKRMLMDESMNYLTEAISHQLKSLIEQA